MATECEKIRGKGKHFSREKTIHGKTYTRCFLSLHQFSNQHLIIREQ